MEFLRVYVQNDGRIKRGAVSNKTTGKLVPDESREVWFNVETGMLCQVDKGQPNQRDVSFYHCSKIQGDITFSIRCFTDHFENKSYEDLIGVPVKKLVSKKVTKKKR